MGCPFEKNAQTIINEFSIILTTSKRRILKIESGRDKGFCNSIFQNFVKIEIIQ